MRLFPINREVVFFMLLKWQGKGKRLGIQTLFFINSGGGPVQINQFLLFYRIIKK
jgi:hypothetical protein